MVSLEGDLKTAATIHNEGTEDEFYTIPVNTDGYMRLSVDNSGKPDDVTVVVESTNDTELPVEQYSSFGSKKYYKVYAMSENESGVIKIKTVLDGEVTSTQDIAFSIFSNL